MELEEERGDSPQERSARDDTGGSEELRALPVANREASLVDQAIQSSLDGNERERERLEEELEGLRAIQKVEEQRRIECEQSLREVETAIMDELRDKDDLECKIEHLESQKKSLEGRVAKLLRVPPMVR